MTLSFNLLGLWDRRDVHGGKETPGTISRFLRRTRYLFHDESGSLCFLLGHLLHLHRLRELLAKGQVGLQGRNQAKSTMLTVSAAPCDPRSSQGRQLPAPVPLERRWNTSIPEKTGTGTRKPPQPVLKFQGRRDQHNSSSQAGPSMSFPVPQDAHGAAASSTATCSLIHHPQQRLLFILTIKAPQQ